jgi:hypothetical protein
LRTVLLPRAARCDLDFAVGRILEGRANFRVGFLRARARFDFLAEVFDLPTAATLRTAAAVDLPMVFCAAVVFAAKTPKALPIDSATPTSIPAGLSPLFGSSTTCTLP